MFRKMLSKSFAAIIIATALSLILTACGSKATADTSQTTMSRADWEASNPVNTMPLQIFQFEVYEPQRMADLEKRALVISGEVVEVGRTDEGGYVVYLSDSASRSRSDYRGGKVAVVIRGKDAEYGSSRLMGRGQWAKYECNNGKYLGNLQFACVMAVIK